MNTPLRDVFFTRRDMDRCKQEHNGKLHLGCPVCFCMAAYFSEALVTRAPQVGQSAAEEMKRRMALHEMDRRGLS